MTSDRRPVDSPAVWQPADLGDDVTWAIELDDAARTGIVTATRAALAEGARIDTIGPDRFPLPSLVDAIPEWARTLGEGRGFLLLRNFPVDLLDDAEIELAYVGLGSHLGTPVGQDRHATLLGHIRDERVPRVDPSVRLYRTRERQDFHTDGADLVGLLCLHRARSGGESRITSSAAVYNEMLRRRPDLVEVMYSPMCWDRNGEESAGEDPFFELPPFVDIGDGVPRIFYIGWYIRDAQRHAEVPRLTDTQLEAMALFESIANDPTFHLEMEFRPGDVQLLNNARTVHAREAYTDDPDPSRRRHLLRLWLAARHFTSVEELLRGGIPEQHL